MEEVRKLINEDVVKLILSNPNSKEVKYHKIVIEKKKGNYNVSKYNEKQVFHENVNCIDLSSFVMNLFNDYKQINIFNNEEEFNVKVSKKGKIFIGRSKITQHIKTTSTHNREKNYILKEGTIIPSTI